MRIKSCAISAAALLIMIAFIGACSSDKQFLIINYQLPAPSEALTGKRVQLTVTDDRADKAFLSDSARKSLLSFNDTYSLVVLKQDGSGNLLGVYDLAQLLSQIFTQRMTNMGMQVVPTAESADFKLEIKLKEFKLDLASQKWVANMNYQADLLKDESVRAMETVSGSAERLRLLKKSDAEKVLGELLTDMANKLDLVRLFQQAQR
jgi:ABC-type uncharacterized transport system auxiliary subunit